MVRMSKKSDRTGICPRRRQKPAAKTGPKQDNLPKGYKEHANAVDGELSKSVFIPKVR